MLWNFAICFRYFMKDLFQEFYERNAVRNQPCCWFITWLQYGSSKENQWKETIFMTNWIHYAYNSLYNVRKLWYQMEKETILGSKIFSWLSCNFTSLVVEQSKISKGYVWKRKTYDSGRVLKDMLSESKNSIFRFSVVIYPRLRWDLERVPLIAS